MNTGKPWRDRWDDECNRCISQATTIPVWWRAPPPGIYKIKWDAALDSKKRKLGFGLIERDSNGHVHATASYSVDAWVEPVVAEALAALRAAEFCQNRGLERIILEGDSLQVVHALNKPRSNWNMHGQIVGDIKVVLRSFYSWEICHTKRGGNTAAHLLAKSGVHSDTDRVWVDCVPEYLREVVYSESSALLFSCYE